MRKCGAAILVFTLMAAAFFLPEWLSRFHDRQLLDTPSIQTQDEEREGFAESVQLTVAEKVLLLRGGGLTGMELSRETVEGRVFVSSAGDSFEVTIITYTGDGATTPAPELSATQEQAAYSEEISQLWEARLASAWQEVRNLQALGGLPMLWDDKSDVTYTGYGERLYVDPDTRMNFQVYQLSLNCAPYSLRLTVDVQSERILSFELQWGRGGAPNWGFRGTSGFGGVWRNYWGLDSVDSGWYNDYIKNILGRSVNTPWAEGDYNANGQITFTYDGQSIPVPLECRAFGGRSYAITWNV